MSVEDGSRLLLQMILRERCIREKEAWNILQKFGDPNEIIVKMTLNIQALGLTVDHELLNGEEYLILKNQRIMSNKNKEPQGSGKDKENTEYRKEDYEYISRFNVTESALYSNILDHIIRKNKYLGYSENNNEYEQICSKLELKKQDVNEKMLKKLHLFKWIKLDEGKEEISLGERFYTDLMKHFSLSHLPICSLCNKALIVEMTKCKECSAPYHEHCLNALSRRLHVCFVCQKNIKT